MTINISLKHIMRSFKYFIFSIILAACSVENSKQEQPTENTKSEKPVRESIQATERITKEKRAACSEEQCTSVTINYPRYEGSPQFNKIIEEKVTRTLSEDYVMEASGSENIDQLISLFIKSYEDFSKNFPESSTAWSLDILVEQTYSKSDVISLRMNTSGYTGGAHSNSFVEYITLSKNSKKPLDIKDIVKSNRKLSSIAEQVFRNLHGIKKGESFSNHGFTFQNDEFVLPETFGLSTDGLVLYYNSYEISSYADGPTELIIPFDQLTELLKI